MEMIQDEEQCHLGILERTCGDSVRPGTWTLGVAHGSVVLGDTWGTCESWILPVPKSVSSE